MKQSDNTKYVIVRRQWNDWQLATYLFSQLDKPHWSRTSGGVMAMAPQPFIHAYVWCDQMVSGELAHSGQHGPCPHKIKVCIVKKDNEPEIYNQLFQIVGPKPKKPKLTQ